MTIIDISTVFPFISETEKTDDNTKVIIGFQTREDTFRFEVDCYYFSSKPFKREKFLTVDDAIAWRNEMVSAITKRAIEEAKAITRFTSREE